MPITLRAHPQPGEILRDGCDRRPHVTVANDDDSDDSGGIPLFLGRNSVTQIADPAVSRRVCQISLSPEGWLTIENIKSMVWVNTQILHSGMKQTLQQGDVVRLPPLGKYTYVVEYPAGHNVMLPPPPAPPFLPDAVASFQTATTTTTKPNHSTTTMTSPNRRKRTAAASTTAATTTTNSSSSSSFQQQQQQQLPVEVREELYCPLCLDLQVRSTLLVPCGHNFCRSCITSTECPVCRETAISQVPCRAVDNIIHGLVQQQQQQQQQQNHNSNDNNNHNHHHYYNGTILPADDVANYQQRMTPASKKSSSSSSSRKKKKKRRLRYGFSENDAICIE